MNWSSLRWLERSYNTMWRLEQHYFIIRIIVFCFWLRAINFCSKKSYGLSISFWCLVLGWRINFSGFILSRDKTSPQTTHWGFLFMPVNNHRHNVFFLVFSHLCYWHSYQILKYVVLWETYPFCNRAEQAKKQNNYVRPYRWHLINS